MDQYVPVTWNFPELSSLAVLIGLAKWQRGRVVQEQKLLHWGDRVLRMWGIDNETAVIVETRRRGRRRIQFLSLLVEDRPLSVTFSAYNQTIHKNH